MILKSVTASFKAAVDVSLDSVTKYGKARTLVFDPLSASSRLRFLFRRHKVLMNMIRWKKYAGDRYGIGELVAKTIKECMMPVAESGWNIGGEQFMKKVRV